MVKGIVKAFPSDDRVENMEVGQLGYIDAYDVIITRKKIYIDRYTPITTSEDYEEGADLDVIAIRRLGPGLTENDFELDFSTYADNLELECNAACVHLEKEKEIYVIFTDFNLEMIDSKKELAEEFDVEDESKLPLSELKKLLAIALVPGTENYERAIQLRDLINEKEAKKEKHHRKH